MKRYLLGELSEVEQAKLEEDYFSDPQLFEQVVRTEQELVDAYVRGQLSQSLRNGFERHYLAHPRRRERMKFAETLATKLDELAESSAAPTAAAGSWWRGLSLSKPQQRWRLAFSVAGATLLIVVGGFWLISENRRMQRELQEVQAERSREARRQSELEQQIAAQQTHAEQLAAELERVRTQQGVQLMPTPTPATPAFVSLVLAVGGVRGTDSGPPSTLIVPSGTAQVRLQLNLREQNYPSYQAVLQSVGGDEIFSHQSLRLRTTASGAGFVFNVSADKLSTGEYILTLRGVNPDGEIDNLSKSLFRVEKR